MVWLYAYKKKTRAAIRAIMKPRPGCWIKLAPPVYAVVLPVGEDAVAEDWPAPPAVAAGFPAFTALLFADPVLAELPTGLSELEPVPMVGCEPVAANAEPVPLGDPREALAPLSLAPASEAEPEAVAPGAKAVLTADSALLVRSSEPVTGTLT